ncbi:hypothetical protein JXL21_01295 [Candidatus Bathyarchaeota archaeon]|nr:hypothetical protein [Candidatus Bathyarchaeota archaeon]
MRRKKTYLLASALAVAVGILLSGYTSPSRHTSVLAVEAGSLGVYWDAECTSPVESLEWGRIDPGDTVDTAVYIRNESEETVQLSIETDGWDPPSAPDHIDLGWDYGDAPLGSGEAVQTDLTLTVSPTVAGVTDFAFVTVISASPFDECLLSDFGTLFAENPDLRMIYPADCAVKPLGCGGASLSDWLSSAFFYVELQSAEEGLDTDAAFIDQETGTPLGGPGSGIISLGGPFVNPVAKHAEADTTPEEDRAPIRFHGEGGYFYFQHWDGAGIPGAGLPTGAINGFMDMFVIETYVDAEGRYMLLCYGFGWKGTYAAGKYFNTVIRPDIESYDCSWVIVRWMDSNGDSFVNSGDDGDTYTVIASGT